VIGVLVIGVLVIGDWTSVKRITSLQVFIFLV